MTKIYMNSRILDLIVGIVAIAIIFELAGLLADIPLFINMSLFFWLVAFVVCVATLLYMKYKIRRRKLGLL